MSFEGITLSIIVPVYNTEKYLKQCLDSLLVQDIDSYEVICIDDGSTDGSRDILKGYSKVNERVKLIFQDNSGPSVARNKGIKEARGKYLMFIDSDDYLEKDSVMKLINIMEEKNLDILAFNFAALMPEGDLRIRERSIPVNKVMTGLEYYKIMMADVSCPMSCINIYNREFMENNELFFHEGIVFEDVELLIRMLARVERMVFADSPIYYYRIRRDSRSNSNRYSPKHIESLYKVIDTYMGMEKTLIEDGVRELIDKRIARSSFQIVNERVKGLVLGYEDEGVRSSELNKLMKFARRSSKKRKKIVAMNSCLFRAYIGYVTLRMYLKKQSM